MSAKAKKYLSERNIKGLSDHDETLVGQCIEKFEQCDKDHNGTLSVNEVKTIIAGTKLNVQAVMDTLDLNADNKVTLDEFLGGIVLVKAENLYRPIFNSFDKNHDGRIEVSDLVEVMKEKGYDEAVLKRFIAQNDLDNDGTMSYEEFMKCFFAPKK